ncbi:hypothetical protein SAMN05216516_101493 [Izhakiella capsodis]|uniref:Uncharacterized protein n=1 Tax=Izhakiella capsodis TaxID=1367852 RepID=A0A1I4V2D4_9GAMM|nr:hypothetical protein SAMN05216516_101493 [Izhakiella capsodis]
MLIVCLKNAGVKGPKITMSMSHVAARAGRTFFVVDLMLAISLLRNEETNFNKPPGRTRDLYPQLCQN